jgi:Schlafen, AlbA_2
MRLEDAMKFTFRHRVMLLHGLIGATVGILVLHPVTRMVYWFEIGRAVDESPGLWHFLINNLGTVFSAYMLPMTGIFALIGAAIGVGFGMYHLAVVAQSRTLNFLEKELAQDLASVIAQGEGEHIEFKSTLRWDSDEKRANRILEAVIAKTITGFMNHRGGSLIIGVADSGEVLGLEGDYMTLKHKNRDGFERCLIDLVKTRLGGDKCSFVHCVFYEIEGKDICRVIVESSSEAVYCQDGKVPRYYLRTGNGTRELDVREALAHAATRRT